MNRFPIKKARQDLEKIQAIGLTEYSDFVKSKQRHIINFHLANNSLYRKIFKREGFEDWAKVPIMTKRHLQQPLEMRLSKGFSVKNVYVNKTSGSSGDPFIFAKDKYCHALTWAVIQDRFSWYDLDFNKSLQARFYGIPLDKKGYYKEKIKDSVSKRFRFSVFDLSDNAFEKHLLKFKSVPFKYINGYTSSIAQFAKFLERKDIILTQICPTLKCCIVTSEMLFQDDRLLMKKQFGVPIVNEYGASELDLIAFENTKGNWQLNSETLFIEILDHENNILPYGQEGRIVITSLFNKAHPFIRYDIGDVGVLSEKSTIKTPILKKLIGRTNDIAVLPSGKKAAGLTFYYITKKIIEDDGNVKEFVIHQLDKQCFKIIYVSTEEISVEQKLNIEKEMKNYLEDGLIIKFERRSIIERSRSGKLKQFEVKF